jgi:hypothetical protein
MKKINVPKPNVKLPSKGFSSYKSIKFKKPR